MHRLIRFLIIVVFITTPLSRVSAQEATPVTGPVYIVQSGDNLTSIAIRFGITTNELITANQIEDPNALKIGDELVIPGLEGVQGYLVTKAVGFGNSLRQLSIQNQVPIDMLVKLNRISSPAELYTGVNLIIPQQDQANSSAKRYLLGSGMSLLEFAVRSGQNPWALLAQNQLTGSWQGTAGQPLFVSAETEKTAAGLDTNPLDQLAISPLPMVQGKTIALSLKADQPLTLTGSLTEHNLVFHHTGENQYVALQGIHAMQEPGIYPLTIQAQLADGSSVRYEQMVIIQDGYYAKDPILLVKDEFIDPTVTQPELEWLQQQTSSVTPERLWDGLWTSPSPYSYKECLNSRYGNRRSYNGGPFENFHTGVDFCGGDGVNIFAPAAGKVVFAGSLTVRGNATIIDHGWGVYTGFWHQQAINVSAGDTVEPGQVIGLVGGTGRVTGAHLHWEIWVNGVQVEPIDWLEEVYPPSLE